jgi:succinate dehydrogenase / fumarate reductase, flavoprotein subunit
MLDLVLVDGHAKGIVVRDMVTGKISNPRRRRRDPGHRRLRQRVLPLHQRDGLQRHRRLARPPPRRLFANPCFTQIHPTCIPVSGDYQSKLTLMSESLRNDGRIWVPKKSPKTSAPASRPPTSRGRPRLLPRAQIPRPSATSRRATSRAAPPRRSATKAAASPPPASACILDFADAIKRLGEDTIKARYGNLFQMYEKITGEDPYTTPMMIYPAVHYTMGGLWVDYNLMSNIPGLHVLGEANFSDHGANRLGASALMQGLADGYFVIPYTIANYLATQKPGSVTTETRSSSAVEAKPRERMNQAAFDPGQAHRGFLPPRTGHDDVGQMRHGPQRRRPREALERSPPSARNSGGTSSSRQRRVAQPWNSKKPAAWPTSSSSPS